MMEKRAKPIWVSPENNNALPKVKLFNSLTNEKEIFKPSNENHVEWYSCGPTVYDSSHMGHARAYISIDILRRVMKDFFKFDIHYVMNITDIDDKIIKRARQNYLFSSYVKSEDRTPQQTAADIDRALSYSISKFDKEEDKDKKMMFKNEIDTIKHVLSNKSKIDESNLIKIKDSLSDLLDKEKGSTVVDNSIFEELPRFYENDFMEDMKHLNVLPPDELTRVSEYIDKIINFVEEILLKGFAYVNNGSVYFDTETFDGSDKHYYAKLVPSAYGNKSLLQEGEGVLSNVESGEKKSENDFALWKVSKPGEPSWDSPWGNGRPGWHIECSAMAGDKCGKTLDIHTGGIDLKFPHHDNELAQSEACFGCNQWVNYFLHTGHLTIAGCKMSKSLKNFITIKDALKSHSSRQLRLMFLMHSWKDTLDYSDESMTAAISYEKMVLDFFFNVEHVSKVQRKLSIDIDCVDEDLQEKLSDVKRKVEESLSDSIDTREVMFALKDLIGVSTNHFMKTGSTNSSGNQLREAAVYVYQILRTFGAADEDCGEFGLVRYSEEDLARIMMEVVKVSKDFLIAIRGAVSDGNREPVTEIIREYVKKLSSIATVDMDSLQAVTYQSFSRRSFDDYLDTLAAFRQSIRTVAIDNKWFSFLGACDALRDEGLASIGICLQDRDDGHAAIGLLPVWTLVAQDKKQVGKKKAQVVKKSKKRLDASVDPKVMFRTGPHEGLYSDYDNEGVPTHDAAGVEISKNKRGKLKKLMAEQQKFFDKTKEK